jgi:hypothetical protein
MAGRPGLELLDKQLPYWGEPQNGLNYFTCACSPLPPPSKHHHHHHAPQQRGFGLGCWQMGDDEGGGGRELIECRRHAQ